MGKTIYLGGAIDSASADSRAKFQEIGALIIGAFGKAVTIFNPFAAFMNANQVPSDEMDEFVVAINTKALMSADLAVFVWSGCPSFGVPYEIVMRSEQNKPIIVYNISGKPAGIYMRHVLAWSSGKIVNDIAEFRDALNNYGATEEWKLSSLRHTLTQQESATEAGLTNG
jgi:hypothetical protein